MSKLNREDFYILNPFYRGMNNEEPLYEQDVTSRLQAIKQVNSVDGCVAALKTPGLQHAVEIAIVRKMKSLLKADGAEAHKRNTALTVELNELCQQQGIGKIGDSIVPALKTYIKNIQGTLDLTERLIINEVADFTAGLGHPGEPETPEQIQAVLMARVQRVFMDVKQQAQPTANDESISAYGDGFYDGFLKGCEFGDEHGKTDTAAEAMRQSEFAESKSVFARGKGVSERIIEIMVEAGQAGFIDGANKQWADNLDDEQMLAAAEAYAKDIRQQAMAGAQ